MNSPVRVRIVWIRFNCSAHFVISRCASMAGRPIIIVHSRIFMGSTCVVLSALNAGLLASFAQYHQFV